MTEHHQESQLITRNGNDLSNEPLGALPSLSSRAMFWRPKYLCQSDWLDHLPFAFWLVDSIQPKVVVELGVGGGASYFAFCQAMDKLSVDGRCYAVESWSQRGQQAVLADVQNYNQTQYEEFSKILDHDYFQAPSLFLDGSVDLLHLNLTDTVQDLALLFQLWQPKLSATAVVLLHHSQNVDLAVVAALKAQLVKQYRHFEFLQQHGLLVVQANKLPSDSFRRLMDVRPGEKTYEIIQHVFSRLGKACSESMNAELARHEVLQVGLVLQDARGELQVRQQRIDTLLTELHEHKQWLTTRNDECGQLSEKLSQTEQQRAEEQTMLNQRIRLLESLRTELKQEVENLFGHVEQLSEEKSQTQAQLQQAQQALELSVQELQQSQHGAHIELAALQQQYQQCVAELQDTQQIVSSLKADRQLRDQQYQQQANELSATQQIVSSFKTDREQREQQYQQQADELSATQQVISSLKTDREQLERQLQVQADELAVRSQELATFTRQAEQQRQSVQQQHQEQLAALQQELQQAQALLSQQKQQQQQNLHLQQELQLAATAQQELKMALATADKNAESRFAELATLTNLYHQAQADLKFSQQQLALANEDLTLSQSALAQQQLLAEQQQTAAQQAAEELVELRQQLAELSPQAARVPLLQQALETKEVELSQCYTELAALGQLVQQQQSTAANDLAQLYAKLKQSNRQQQQMLQTTSWKITAPLRSVSKLFSGKADSQQQLQKELALVEKSGLFDENWYLSQYPDVATAGISPLQHYLRFGGFEGRRPNPDFDSAFYLAQYPDVVKEGLNPLVHFVRFGRAEQRLVSIHTAEENL